MQHINKLNTYITEVLDIFSNSPASNDDKVCTYIDRLQEYIKVETRNMTMEDNITTSLKEVLNKVRIDYNVSTPDKTRDMKRTTNPIISPCKEVNSAFHTPTIESHESNIPVSEACIALTEECPYDSEMTPIIYSDHISSFIDFVGDYLNKADLLDDILCKIKSRCNTKEEKENYERARGLLNRMQSSIVKNLRDGLLANVCNQDEILTQELSDKILKSPAKRSILRCLREVLSVAIVDLYDLQTLVKKSIIISKPVRYYVTTGKEDVWVYVDNRKT